MICECNTESARIRSASRIHFESQKLGVLECTDFWIPFFPGFVFSWVPFWSPFCDLDFWHGRTEGRTNEGVLRDPRGPKNSMLGLKHMKHCIVMAHSALPGPGVLAVPSHQRGTEIVNGKLFLISFQIKNIAALAELDKGHKGSHRLKKNVFL